MQEVRTNITGAQISSIVNSVSNMHKASFIKKDFYINPRYSPYDPWTTGLHSVESSFLGGYNTIINASSMHFSNLSNLYAWYDATRGEQMSLPCPLDNDISAITIPQIVFSVGESEFPSCELIYHIIYDSDIPNVNGEITSNNTILCENSPCTIKIYLNTKNGSITRYGDLRDIDDHQLIWLHSGHENGEFEVYIENWDNTALFLYFDPGSITT